LFLFERKVRSKVRVGDSGRVVGVGGWLRPEAGLACVAGGGRLTIGEALGVSSLVARNGGRSGGRWQLWWAWLGEVASLVARC
jgi:hypothetical protein